VHARRFFKPLISVMLAHKSKAKLNSFSRIAICQMGSVPKRWIPDLSYGADWSVDALDVFFSEDDFGLSAVLVLAAFFEVALLGADLLA